MWNCAFSHSTTRPIRLKIMLHNCSDPLPQSWLAKEVEATTRRGTLKNVLKTPDSRYNMDYREDIYHCLWYMPARYQKYCGSAVQKDSIISTMSSR